MKRRIIAAVIVVLAASAGLYARFAAGALPVDTAVIARGAVMEFIEDTGTVRSRQVSLISARDNYEILAVLCELGGAVEAGAPLINTDAAGVDSSVSSIQAQISGLRARQAQAGLDAGRLLELYESGAVSRSEYDAAATLEKEISAQIQSLEYEINKVRESARSSRVTAPVSGSVTELFVSAGDTAVMGAPLVEISDLANLYIGAELLADDGVKTSVGDRVILPDHPGAESRVEKISPKVAEEMSDLGITQKRVSVEISVDDPARFILGGDVDLQIVTQEKDDALTAPRKAVFSLEGRDYAYVASDGRAALREITIGLKGKDVYEVLTGLSEGERVIISPSGDIEDGSRVEYGE
jgi:HlyD family secretion protein